MVNTHFNYSNIDSIRVPILNILFICIDNTADTWRQELMGLAQQVQASLIPTDESQHSRLSRLHHHHHAKRSRSSISSYHPDEKDEQNISKRLLNRRASARYPRSQLTKSKISNDKNEQESSVNNENQDAGIWVIFQIIFFLNF
jgi:hypothetical protein